MTECFGHTNTGVFHIRTIGFDSNTDMRDEEWGIMPIILLHVTINL